MQTPTRSTPHNGANPARQNQPAPPPAAFAQNRESAASHHPQRGWHADFSPFCCLPQPSSAGAVVSAGWLRASCRSRIALERAPTGSLAKKLAVAVDHIRSGEGTSHHVLVGPLALCAERRQWSLVVGSADNSGFRADQIVFGSDKRHAEACRAALIAELVRRRPPLVLHNPNDELDLAKLAKAIWPSPATNQIHAAIEAERVLPATPGSA